jgi:ribosome-binding protein aMBF1 (putative translation factor)
MEKVKSIGEWMADRGIGLEQLLESTALDRRILLAIVNGQYTPSPQQRRRLAAALGIEVALIAWGHTTEVQHIYGHGPQFGRSP